MLIQYMCYQLNTFMKYVISSVVCIIIVILVFSVETPKKLLMVYIETSDPKTVY